MIWTVAKKELRGYFNSAIAVIFLAAFLVVTMYTFFWREKFFARGSADLRPLFEWMPKLVIILVSALSMRLWSDERRAGTLEVLLTLPVPRWKLVVGKFLAGMLLIALALALTLGLPITVSQMGNLDMGPVIGGYLAALLLSAAYLAIGMCISAATDNSIVAFVGTALACSIAYAIGEIANMFRAIGTGTRFASVARGVLDLRDLAYYGIILVIGVAVNVLILQSLSWATGPRAAPRRRAALIGVALVVANAIAFGLWLAPIKRARIDLTRDNIYSLSEPTKRILSGLDERVLIRGYFSEKTHPKLAPLIPQIKDLLAEYELAGGDKVRVEIADPTESDALKLDAKERFGIDPTPLQFATDTEQSVVNAYFAIGIEYGDQHVVLGLQDLVLIRPAGDDVDVTLKNFEYQMTRTIKKAVADFSSVDTLFASATGKVQITAYMSKTLPEQLKDAPAKIAKIAEKLKAQSKGKLEFTQVDPTTDAERRSLAQQYGLQPYPDLFSGSEYYFHLIVQVGNRIVRVSPPQEMGDAEIERVLVEGLKRAAPGFTRVVGMWVPPASEAMPPMMQGMPPQQMPPPQQFEELEHSLRGNYEVRTVDLATPVDQDVEVLVLAGPANLSAAEAEHVDQYLMHGGAIVLLDGRFRLSLTGGLALEKVTTGLEGVLKAWGIQVGEELVLDSKADAFPIPQNRDVGNGMMIREIAKLPYPYFVQAAGDQLSGANPITAGLSGSVMHFASPVSVEAQVGEDKRKVETLIVSSGDSWTSTSTSIEPDLRTYPDVGFPPPEKDAKRGARPLAIAVTGGFATGTPAPAKPTDPAAAKDTPRRAEHSSSDARIVVFGSSAFVSDDLLNLAKQLGSQLAESNVELVHNAVDWALADTDLLEIRSHNAAANALTIAPDSHASWRNANLVIAAIALGLVILASWLRRRAVKPVLVGKDG